MAILPSSMASARRNCTSAWALALRKDHAHVRGHAGVLGIELAGRVQQVNGVGICRSCIFPQATLSVHPAVVRNRQTVADCCRQAWSVRPVLR